MLLSFLFALRLAASDGVKHATVDIVPRSGGAIGVSSDRSTIESPFLFTHVGMKWLTRGDSACAPDLRTSADGQVWGEWTSVRESSDLADEGDWRYSGLLSGAEARFVQVRIACDTAAAAPIEQLTLFFIDPGKSLPEKREIVASNHDETPSIIARGEWGCPEGADAPGWPPAHAAVSHLIVHHTDGASAAADWSAEVRAIWVFHTISRGWGDIGYNLLIDPLGRIYEGRAGGVGAIGAHFSCRNTGTAGVALLGNYVSSLPTPEALDALARVLAWLSSVHELDAREIAFHAPSALQMARISGHRDGNLSSATCSRTACPGDALYAFLPELRLRVGDLAAHPLCAIESFEPASGAIGATVTIRGANFIEVSRVDFNGAEASFEVISATEIRAIVPAGARSGVISVTTPVDRGVSTGRFTVVGNRRRAARP